MDQKQLKRNRNYFTKSDTPMYVGIGMLVVGVVLYFVTYSYVVYIIASVLAAAGLILALIGASVHVSDADLDHCVVKLTEGMEVDLVENPKFAKRMRREVPVAKVQSYVFDDALAHKYGKSGTIRTEKLESTLLYPLDTALYVVHRRISLLSDECDTQIYELPYTEIEGIEIAEQQTTLTFGKNTRTVSYCTLCIHGATPLALPMQSNADTDDFVSRMRRVLAESKQQAQ